MLLFKLGSQATPLQELLSSESDFLSEVHDKRNNNAVIPLVNLSFVNKNLSQPRTRKDRA